MVLQGEAEMSQVNYWHKLWLEKFVQYNKSEERRLIKSGKFALYTQILTNTVLLDSPPEDDLLDSLRVVRDTIKRYHCTTVLRKHSPLQPFYDKVINLLYERGLLKGLWVRSGWNNQKKSYQRLTKDPDLTMYSEKTAIKIDIFQYILYMLAVGFILSSICFVLELVVNYTF